MRFPIIGILVSCVVACGGSTGTELFGTDSGTTGHDSGNTGNDSGNNNDSGSKDGGVGNDSGKDCKAMLMQLEQLRFAATACSPTVGDPPCGKQLTDLCCPFSVTDDNSPESKAFEAALAAFKNQCTPPVCPGIPCSPNPSDTCNPNGHCAR